jgi:hypothetical protein
MSSRKGAKVAHQDALARDTLGCGDADQRKQPQQGTLMIPRIANPYGDGLLRTNIRCNT